MLEVHTSPEPKSAQPEGASWASSFFDLRNSPLVALVMPALVDPCKSDGALDIVLLNKKVNRTLQSVLGRETTITALRQNPLAQDIVATPDVVVAIGEPILHLRSPMLYSIVNNSIPIGGGGNSDRGDRYDGCSVSGLNLNLSLGAEHLKIHIGEYDHSGWGRNEYTELNRLFDGALSSRYSRYSTSGFSDRYLAERPEEIAIFSALLSDLVADFQEKKSGAVSHSRLFPRSSASFNLDSVDKEIFHSLLIPSMDSGSAGSSKFRQTIELLERVVTGAAQEGLAESETYRASLDTLKAQTETLYGCINYNHMDYFTGVSPGFDALASDIQHNITLVIDQVKTVANSTQSMLLFEQAHQAISNVVIACS